MAFLRRIHNALHCYFIKRFRTREALRVFSTAHAAELKDSPYTSWPQIKARQQQEIAAIQAGKLDITDRKSWQFPYLPASINRLSVPIAKTIPYSLRRMSRTPVPRRAINMIKGSVTAQNWDVRPIEGIVADDPDEQAQRIKIGKSLFKHPNNQDSFQSLLEMMIEDLCVVGSTALEMRFTVNPDRPLKCWAVNTDSVRIFTAWSESTPEMPHYAQMTGLKGERGAIIFYDDELMYLRDNQATDSPFGLGKMEVAMQSVNAVLGVQDMAGKAGADQIHKCWLWWEQPQADASYQIVRRHIQNELEGQAKVSIIGGMKKPEIVEINPVTVEDLLLPWQEMLIRMIANAFDLSAMSLGITEDVNRATGAVLGDRDFRTAVVPMARRIEDAFTRRILHAKLGWYDLEFKFLNLDDPDAQTKMGLFAQQYSTNAITPNEIAIGMGRQPQAGPFGALTQFEAMIVMQLVTAQIQDKSADKNVSRQQDMMLWQQKQQDAMNQPPPTDGTDPNGGGDHNGEDYGPPSPSVQPQEPRQLPAPAQDEAKDSAAPALPKMTLPKFPVAGSSYTAMDLAKMPLDKLTSLVQSGAVGKPDKLLPQMKNQEPNILEQMSEGVRDFFDGLQKQADADLKRKVLTPEQQKTLAKQQTKRRAKQGDRTSDYSEFLYKEGNNLGKPGGPRMDRKGNKSGTPGDINYWQRP